MKLTPPKVFTWWLCVIVAAVSVLLKLGYMNIPNIPALTQYIYWMAVGSAGLLALASLFKGL